MASDEASVTPGATPDSAGQADGGGASEDEGPKLLDQSELEALLAQFNAEKNDAQAKSQSPLDEQVVPKPADELLDQRELDALLADSQAALEKPLTDTEGPLSVTEEASGQAAFLSQEELDQLISAMEEDKPLGEMAQMDEAIDVPAEPVASHPVFSKVDVSTGDAQVISAENVASAAPEEDALISQELLDSLLSEAKSSEAAIAPATMPVPEVAAATSPAPVPASAPQAQPPPTPAKAGEKRFRKPLPIREMLKWGVSLAAGLLCALATYSFVSSIQRTTPSLETLKETAADDLLNAVETAKYAVGSGEYGKAIYVLDKAIGKASSKHPLLPDAEFLRLSARMAAVPPNPTQAQIQTVLEETDALVAKYPGHRSVPDALRGKAEVYQKTGQPELAFETYMSLFDRYAEMPNEDTVLFNAAKLAADLRRFSDAAKFAQRLVDKFPGSPRAPAAELILADALANDGNIDIAKRILQKVSLAQPYGTAGADAVARLARIEINAGQCSTAAERLEQYIKETTSAAGHGGIHLLLAKAYEGMGRLDDAAQVLRDVIAFFPDAPEIPEAYVALAEILDKQGKRRDATRLIQQASLRYPQDANVMRSLGKYLAARGDLVGAADALEAAEAAGARDPDLLLEAARYSRAAGDHKRARDLYERLIMNYPSVPQAFQGRLEIAKTFQEQGLYRKAFDTLQDLAALSTNKPQHVPVLFSLAELYDEMGFRTSAAQAYGRIATLTGDARELARAALGMLKNGALHEGLEIANRVNPDILPPTEAYAFLQGYGKAMLKNDPPRGLDLLEKAYGQYPDQRTGTDMFDLFAAYVASDRRENAQTVVEDLDRLARVATSELPAFQRAVLTWGDYLFEKKEFASAAQAYARVPALSESADNEYAWASFQRASALLHLGEYETALPLLDELAGGKTPWAPLAKQKAAFARIEQSLAGRLPSLAATAIEAGTS